MIQLFFLLLLSCQIICVFSVVTFEKGFQGGFYYINNIMNLYTSTDAGRSLNLVSYFSNTFQRIPQIYIVVNEHDYGNSYPVGYNLIIHSVTQTNFQVTVSVPHTNIFFGIEFYWYAFDDERRIVINAFNYSPSPTYTFTHSNPNFAKAVVSLISFLFNGYMDVRLQVESVTSNSVTIRQSYSSSAVSIGFQILIGINEAISVGTSIQCSSSGGFVYIATPVGWSGSDYMTSIEGMAWNNNINLRIRTYQSISDSTVKFSAGSSPFDKLYINYFFTLTQWNPGTYYPMLAYDYFQTNILDETNTLQQKLSILELSATLTPGQIQTYDINSNTLYLTYEIYLKCYTNELWTIYVLKCVGSFQVYQIQCDQNKKFNTIRLIIKYKQDTIMKQKITANPNWADMFVRQIIIDYSTTTYDILKIYRS